MALGARMREELMAYSCLVEHGTKVPHWHLNPRSLHDRSTPAGSESQKGAGAPRRLGSVDTDILFPGSSIFLGLPDLLPRGERFCGQAKPEQGGASPGAVAEIDQARPLIGPTRRAP